MIKTFKKDTSKSLEEIFKNLEPLLKPETVANLLGRKISTIYDWSYRAKTRKLPINLFVRINGRLLIDRDVLKAWITSQNSVR